MNLLVLLAVPPIVVIVIGPVTALAGTVAVTCLSEFTLNSVAATPPKVTSVVCLRLPPIICTCVPTGPLVGLMRLICGRTRKATLLQSVPLSVLTLTLPCRRQPGPLS